MTAPARRPVDDALDRLEQALAYNPNGPEVPLENEKRDLATVRAEVERLREERDAAWTTQGRYFREALAAEAREQRLTEGLRETADELASRRGMIDRAVAAEKFRALLAASPDGANTEAAPNEVPADWGALDEGDVISLRVFDPRWGWEREHRTVTRVFSDGSVSFLDRDTNREYTVERDDKDWLDRSPLFVSRGANTEGGEA